jgi:hypothetical protein
MQDMVLDHLRASVAHVDVVHNASLDQGPRSRIAASRPIRLFA